MKKKSAKLIVTDIERITVRAPMTPRCEEWNAREVWQWCICEIVRLTTDAGFVGYGETLPHYTWGRVSDEAVARVRGANAADFLGDDTLGAGLQMALYDVVGKALGVPAYRLFNLPSVREAVPIAWWNIDFPPEALAEEAKDALAIGQTRARRTVRVTDLSTRCRRPTLAAPKDTKGHRTAFWRPAISGGGARRDMRWLCDWRRCEPCVARWHDRCAVR
jgi:L-alanine-DL-glutamate epimerase-like enolase superfamily enzyme